MKNGWYLSPQQGLKHLLLAVKDNQGVVFYNANGRFDETVDKSLLPKKLTDLPSKPEFYRVPLGKMQGFYHSCLQYPGYAVTPGNFPEFFAAFEDDSQDKIQENLDPLIIFDIY